MFWAICFCLFTSCEKDALIPISETSTFDVSILVAHCADGGTILSVQMPNPEEYAYMWEINGNPGGHDTQTDGCQCILTASTIVTRLSDSQRVKQTISISDSCGSMLNPY